MTAELFTAQVLSSSTRAPGQEVQEFKEGDVYDWSSGLEDADDSQIYFSPDQGHTQTSPSKKKWIFSSNSNVSCSVKPLFMKFIDYADCYIAQATFYLSLAVTELKLTVTQLTPTLLIIA